METKKLKELINFMNEHNLCELEIEEEGKRIKLKRSSPETPVFIKESISQQPAAQATEQKQKSNFIEIKSPMVGTFYRAASPGAKSYTDIGQTIKSGDVICIIEAMKLMNEIKSEITGEIVEIPAENGEPVEFGQIIFLVKPL